MTLPSLAGKVKARFQQFDNTVDGKIAKDDLKKLLTGLSHDSERNVERMMTAFDKNQEGCVDYKQFLDWIFDSNGVQQHMVSECTAMSAQHVHMIENMMRYELQAVLKKLLAHAEKAVRFSVETALSAFWATERAAESKSGEIAKSCSEDFENAQCVRTKRRARTVSFSGTVSISGRRSSGQCERKSNSLQLNSVDDLANLSVVWESERSVTETLSGNAVASKPSENTNGSGKDFESKQCIRKPGRTRTLSISGRYGSERCGRTANSLQPNCAVELANDPGCTQSSNITVTASEITTDSNTGEKPKSDSEDNAKVESLRKSGRTRTASVGGRFGSERSGRNANSLQLNPADLENVQCVRKPGRTHSLSIAGRYGADWCEHNESTTSLPVNYFSKFANSSAVLEAIERKKSDSTIATPDTVTKLDSGLVRALTELGLIDFADQLKGLGVVEAIDVLVLSDFDLGGTGMSIVQMRRLQRTLWENVDALDNAEEEPGGEARSSRSTFVVAPAVPTLEAESDDEEEEEEKHEVAETPLAGPSRRSSITKRRHSLFWRTQLNRPLRLIFIRHGESEAKIDRDITRTVPYHMVRLTTKGREQALDAGRRLKTLIGEESVKFIVSPCVCTRETFNGIKQAWGNTLLEAREDVRIREQDFGNYHSPDMQVLHQRKKQFGAFYFRFPEGESPADCYDRASSFFETMYRSWEDNTTHNQVIIGHGIMMQLLLMRLMRFSVEEWEMLDRLRNCEFVVLERPPDDGKYFISFTWCGGEEQDRHGEHKDRNGLRVKPGTAKQSLEVWDGKPDAPIMMSRKSQISV